LYGANGEFVPPTVVGATLIACAVFLLWNKVHGPVRQKLVAVGGMTTDDGGAPAPELSTAYKLVIVSMVLIALIVGFSVTGWLAAPAQMQCMKDKMMKAENWDMEA